MKNPEAKDTILLCVAGMTPQIITETLFALFERRERVVEVRVITTLGGRDRIINDLLDPVDGKFYALCRDHGIDANSILFNETTIALLGKPDGTTFDDIRTPEENALAGDRICEIVSELCRRDDVRIHASVAGGRKTMSIYLTAAMQIFGRSDDALSHVLVSEDFESNPAFFFPPSKAVDLTTRDGRIVSTADANVFLAPIPFIRLRGVTGFDPVMKRFGNYGEVVNNAQKYLDAEEREYPMSIDLVSNMLSAGPLGVRVSDYELLLFLIFVARKSDGAEGFIGIREIGAADLSAAFKRIIRARQGEECPLTEERLANTEWKFLVELAEQSASANPRDYQDFMNSVIRSIGRANKKIRQAGIPPKYEITSKGGSRPKRYGIDLPLELICIEPVA